MKNNTTTTLSSGCMGMGIFGAASILAEKLASKINNNFKTNDKTNDNSFNDTSCTQTSIPDWEKYNIPAWKNYYNACNNQIVNTHTLDISNPQLKNNVVNNDLSSLSSLDINLLFQSIEFLKDKIDLQQAQIDFLTKKVEYLENNLLNKP